MLRKECVLLGSEFLISPRSLPQATALKLQTLVKVKETDPVCIFSILTIQIATHREVSSNHRLLITSEDLLQHPTFHHISPLLQAKALLTTQSSQQQSPLFPSLIRSTLMNLPYKPLPTPALHTNPSPDTPNPSAQLTFPLQVCGITYIFSPTLPRISHHEETLFPGHETAVLFSKPCSHLWDSDPPHRATRYRKKLLQALVASPHAALWSQRAGHTVSKL